MTVPLNGFKLWLLKRLLRDKKVYDICSGLRGPDYILDSGDGSGDKIASAAVLRFHLGITHLECFAISDCIDFAKRRSEHHEETSKNWHFWKHQRDAFKALGLGWNVSND